jgi:hypothetical protein
MPIPADYWASFEQLIGSLNEYTAAIEAIAAYQQATDSRFVWRGVGNANWGLHSLLVRSYEKLNGDLPTELQLRSFERRVIGEAREWNLDFRVSGGRLTALELLARLQHFEVPTRLLDFTLNPLIALWFAVQPNLAVDGRVFAVDISTRVVARAKTIRREPWWWGESYSAGDDWCRRSWIWLPPPVEDRIVRQQGCFLTGGVPSTQPARNIRTAAGGWRPLRAAEVRQCMSVPLVMISYRQAIAVRTGQPMQGQPPRSAAFTLRIQNRAGIRQALERTYGLSARSLFPDPPGMAKFGTSFQ